MGAFEDYFKEQQQKGGTAPTPQTPLFTPPGQPLPGPAKADLTPEFGRQVWNATLSSLPFLGAAGAVAFGQPEMAMPVLGRMTDAAGGAGLMSLIESGLRKATNTNPLPGSGMEFVGNAANKGLLDAGGNAAAEGLGTVPGFLLRRFTPRGLLQSAIMPTGSTSAEIKDLMDAALRERIPVGEGAAEVANARKGEVQQQISDLIRQNPQNIPRADWVDALRQRMDDLRSFWGKDPTDGPSFLKQIDDAEEKFLLNHGNPQPGTLPNGQTLDPQNMTLRRLRLAVQDLPADQAQQIKKTAYEAIRTIPDGAFKEGAHPGLATRIKRDMAGAMRETLEGVYPDTAAGTGISQLNSREADLIGLQTAFDKWQRRTGNYRATPYFVLSALGGLGGGLLSHSGEGMGGGAAAGLIAADVGRRLLEAPESKASLAYLMDDFSKSAAGRAGQAIMGSKLGKVITMPNALRGGGLLVKQKLSSDDEDAPDRIQQQMFGPSGLLPIRP